jgi:hypothetical protein
MLVKLRVQNPNDAPFDYDGLSVRIGFAGQTLCPQASAMRWQFAALRRSAGRYPGEYFGVSVSPGRR